MRRTWLTSLRVVLFVALVGLVAPWAAGQDGPLFDYREQTLENGLRVITLEDFSCPIVAVHLWYHVGSKDEDPNRQGFAHMFEHMMFRGTDRLGPTDHFDFIRRTGGTTNAYTSWDQTVYVATVPSNQLELVLWLEAERMAFLKIDQESFDTERKVVEEERRLGLSRPYGRLGEKLFAELFKVHPYRWLPIGSIGHLRAAGVDELRQFWTRYYVPNNATLVIVGAVEHEKAQDLARKYFGWIPRYPDPPRVTVREPLPEQPRTVSFKEENAPAPAVGLVYPGVPVGHEDEAAVQLMVNILGGGQSSRLHRDLVAETQLAVGAIAAPISMEQGGFIALGAAMTPFGANLDKVLSRLEEHVERIRSEPVSEKELTKVRNQALRALVTQNMTVVSKASVLGSSAVLAGDVSRVNGQLDRLRAVTVEDIQRVANKYLDPQRVLRGKVESNLLGSLFGRKKDAEEEESPITAEPETNPPPPGRPGLTRPESFPDKPPIAGLLEFDAKLDYQSATLSNGMKLLVVENHELPFVNFRLGLRAGAWTETKPGAASMACAMLDKGSANHTEAELAEELEMYAISLNASAGLDSAAASASALTEHAERAVMLLAEVVRTATFPEEEFEKLRARTLTGLAVSTNEPGYIAEREFRRRIFGEHPYARTATGEPQDVRELTAEDSAEWWRRFARPDSCVLIVSGDVNLERARSLAEAAFGDWKAEGPRPEVELPPVPETEERRIYLVDRPGVQSQIRVGHAAFPLNHPAYFTSRVAGGYFGEAFNARLNETIRVKLGLTYGARGGWSADRFAGRFITSTFTKTATVAQTVETIFAEWDRLREEPPTDEELQHTKTYILGSFAADRETPMGVASQLWTVELHGLGDEHYVKYMQAVAETSAEDCVQLARATVHPDRAVIVVVGPADELRADLEKIAPVTVVEPDGSERPAQPEREE